MKLGFMYISSVPDNIVNSKSRTVQDQITGLLRGGGAGGEGGERSK